MAKSIMRLSDVCRLLCVIATAVLSAAGHTALAQITPPPDPGRPWFTTGDMAMAASERPRASLDQVVEGFWVEQATVPQVFEYLFNRDHLIVGIELIAPPSQEQDAPGGGERYISGSFGPAPLRLLLDQVVALDPEFVWVEDADVANLVRRGNTEDPRYALNRRIECFDADDRPFARALQDVLLLQQHELGGWPWGFGLRRDPDACPCVTIHLEGPTVREVLNEIAWQSGLAWRALFRPGDKMMGLLVTSEFDGYGEGCGECAPCSAAPLSAAVESDGEGKTATAASRARLVPLRDSLGARGFALAWDAETRRATACDGRTRVSVAANDVHAAINGLPLTLPAPPTLENGRLHVPAAFVTLVLNAQASHLASQPAS